MNIKMKTTHIGSLPFLELREAVDFNIGLSLPCVPTLPFFNESELMLNQFLDGFLDVEHEIQFLCLDLFLKKFKGKKIKIQFCGIQTLFNSQKISQDKELIKSWYTNTIKKLLSTIPNEVVIFFDEPDLRCLDKQLWSAYKNFKEYSLGLHSCSSLNWKSLSLDEFEYISFDTHLLSEESKSFLVGLDKILLWGSLNTIDGSLSVDSLVGCRRGDYLSPSCGLGLSSLETVETILAYLRLNRD